LVTDFVVFGNVFCVSPPPTPEIVYVCAFFATEPLVTDFFGAFEGAKVFLGGEPNMEKVGLRFGVDGDAGCADIVIEADEEAGPNSDKVGDLFNVDDEAGVFGFDPELFSGDEGPNNEKVTDFVDAGKETGDFVLTTCFEEVDTSELGEAPNVEKVGDLLVTAGDLSVPIKGGVDGDKATLDFCVAAICLASAASFRASAAACRSSSVLLIPLTGAVELASETDGVLGVALVTSDVLKNDENASVTGSCGFSLIVDFTGIVGSNFKFAAD